MRTSPPLFTYWLALCGRPWWEQQAAFNVWSHFAEKESCHWESSGRVWRRNQWRDTNKTNLIFCSRAWNRTLTNLKLSIQRDCCQNCSHLCFCFFFFPLKKKKKKFCFRRREVELNTSPQPAGSFYTEPPLMKEIRATERKGKSAWRIQKFHLRSISYSNAAIML